jgi:hypothetical protein
VALSFCLLAAAVLVAAVPVRVVVALVVWLSGLIRRSHFQRHTRLLSVEAGITALLIQKTTVKIPRSASKALSPQVVAVPDRWLITLRKLEHRAALAAAGLADGVKARSRAARRRKQATQRSLASQAMVTQAARRLTGIQMKNTTEQAAVVLVLPG